jgi:hypothetical protein
VGYCLRKSSCSILGRMRFIAGKFRGIAGGVGRKVWLVVIDQWVGVKKQRSSVSARLIASALRVYLFVPERCTKKSCVVLFVSSVDLSNVFALSRIGPTAISDAITRIKLAAVDKNFLNTFTVTSLATHNIQMIIRLLDTGPFILIEHLSRQLRQTSFAESLNSEGLRLGNGMLNRSKRQLPECITPEL